MENRLTFYFPNKILILLKFFVKLEKFFTPIKKVCILHLTNNVYSSIIRTVIFKCISLKSLGAAEVDGGSSGSIRGGRTTRKISLLCVFWWKTSMRICLVTVRKKSMIEEIKTLIV